MATMPIKILFLHSGDDWMRGSEIALLTLLRGIDRARIDPILLTSNAQLADAAAPYGIRTFVRPIPQIMIDLPTVKFPVALWYRTVRSLCALIRSHGIEMIYCNGGSTCQIGYYAGKFCKVPVISHLHSLYDKRHVFLYRLHLASHVIFVSKSVEKFVRSKHEFRATSEVVLNGVDLTRLHPLASRDLTWRDRFNIPRNATVFGQVSSLIPRKGIDVLLRAFQQVSHRPEAYLILVGEGSHRDEYARLAGELGITDRVIWAGQTDPLPFYQNVFDVNVLASRNDAFPLTLLEAAGCGLPSLAANVDGIPEAIDDGQTGLLFEPGNPYALAEKMIALIDEPQLCKTLGAAARSRALSCFSVERFCDSIQRIVIRHVNASEPTIEGESSCLLRGF